MIESKKRMSKKKNRPIAAVYRGEVACEGCSESVAKLLRNSPMNYKVHYLGPDEDHDINEKTLNHLDLFAWPGGGDDEDKDFKKIAHYTKDVQNYIDKGGSYLGICLGAFFAKGKSPKHGKFFDLLPKGSYVSGERFQPGSQVKDTKDTIILTDWTFGSGKRKGEKVKNRWQYFQDGAQIHLTTEFEKQSKIMGRYVNTTDPSAVIVPYGKGSVGLIGFHPEADRSWYDDENIHNPQNVSFELGYDFVRTLHEFQRSDSSTNTFLVQRSNVYDQNLTPKSDSNNSHDGVNNSQNISTFHILMLACPIFVIFTVLYLSKRRNSKSIQV